MKNQRRDVCCVPYAAVLLFVFMASAAGMKWSRMVPTTASLSRIVEPFPLLAQSHISVSAIFVTELTDEVDTSILICNSGEMKVIEELAARADSATFIDLGCARRALCRHRLEVAQFERSTLQIVTDSADAFSVLLINCRPVQSTVLVDLVMVNPGGLHLPANILDLPHHVRIFSNLWAALTALYLITLMSRQQMAWRGHGKAVLAGAVEAGALGAIAWFLDQLNRTGKQSPELAVAGILCISIVLAGGHLTLMMVGHGYGVTRDSAGNWDLRPLGMLGACIGLTRIVYLVIGELTMFLSVFAQFLAVRWTFAGAYRTTLELEQARQAASSEGEARIVASKLAMMRQLRVALALFAVFLLVPLLMEAYNGSSVSTSSPLGTMQDWNMRALTVFGEFGFAVVLAFVLRPRSAPSTPEERERTDEGEEERAAREAARGSESTLERRSRPRVIAVYHPSPKESPHAAKSLIKLGVLERSRPGT